MIKIAEIWGSSVKKVASELELGTEGVTHIILDFLCEVQYELNDSSYYQILEIAHRDNIPVVILTPYLREKPPLLDLTRYKNIKIIHWETFWFNRTYQLWKYHQEYNLKKNLDITDLRFGETLTDFKYPYITLNNISKQHRCDIMDLLAKFNLIEKGAISWRDIRRNCDDIRDTFPKDVTDSVFCGYQYKYWKPKRIFLDQNLNDKFIQETMPDQFNSSFMQLVTESDDRIIFFTEKTATPIFLNKIFLIGGAKGYHRALRDRGFQLYDEIFDYSFDDIEDDTERYEGLIENINRISSLSSAELKKLHSSLFEKIVSNKRHALNLIQYIPKEVEDLLELITKENKDHYTGPLNMFL